MLHSSYGLIKLRAHQGTLKRLPDRNPIKILADKEEAHSALDMCPLQKRTAGFSQICILSTSNHELNIQS